MVRPRKTAGYQKVALSLSVPRSHRDRFKALAKEVGVSEAQLGREAIRILLDELTPREVRALLGADVC